MIRQISLMTLVSVGFIAFNALAFNRTTYFRLTPSDFRHLVTASETLMMNNVSPAGTRKGTVLASPSTNNPNYYYMWVRDAALTMNVVQDRQALFDYVDISLLQQSEPGQVGLGEPKYMSDGSVFTGPWGRPQNDGPALRAITVIGLANRLIDEGNLAYVRSKLYDGKLPTHSLVKADLEYVAAHWQDPNFDLWEESLGQHLYTLLAQRKALQLGSALAKKLNDPQAASFYAAQAQAIDDSLTDFWDPSRGYLVGTIDQQVGPDHTSGLDVSVILAALHSTSGSESFGVTDDRVLATAYALEMAFRNTYRINQIPEFQNLGTAIGRYPEDWYDGYNAKQGVTLGNPWFLATNAYAELYYRANRQFRAQGSIHISALNKVFFEHLTALKGTTFNVGDVYYSGDAKFTAIVNALVTDGDRFLACVKFHANGDNLSEEFNRDTGYMQGAHDLTWSYASMITAVNARP